MFGGKIQILSIPSCKQNRSQQHVKYYEDLMKNKKNFHFLTL